MHWVWYGNIGLLVGTDMFSTQKVKYTDPHEWCDDKATLTESVLLIITDKDLL